MRLSILIPVYHEEVAIAKVLEQVVAVDLSSLGFEKEIIACDDGSTDRTVAEIERAIARLDAPIRLVRHERNYGKGSAIRTALEHAKGDYVLIQDGDLEYDTDDYPAILSAINNGADAVYGSRFLEKKWPTGMRVPNFLANRMLTIAANVLYGHGITDEATCFKAIRTDLLRSFDLECERFEFCPEVTAKLGKHKVHIVEVPIRYEGRDAASGKKIRWTDGLVALWVLIKHRFRR